ncbi:hypothetical protein [Nostoc sp. 106C]|nr:hypothetical protein [Nostoc sp. 106C]
MGGFPDLSEVAFERSETQLDQGLRMLGFVPNGTKLRDGSQ